MQCFLPLFHLPCCLLVIRVGHNLIFASQVFLADIFHSSFLALSWFLLFEALKRVMLFTTLVINSVFCWSLKLVTILYSHRMFFWHLSHCLLLATSWVLFYEASKRLMLFTTLFINNVVCWSPEMVTFGILAFDFFFLTSLLQFVSSNLKDCGLRSFEAYFAGYYFLYLHCSLLLTGDGHNHHTRIATFFKLSFCSSLLTTSWFLICEALKCVMLFTFFPSTGLSVG